MLYIYQCFSCPFVALAYLRGNMLAGQPTAAGNLTALC